MSGMVLPVDVEVWLDEQQREPSKRQREEDRPENHGAGGPYPGVERRPVSRQLWPVVLVVSAAIADIVDRPGLSFYLLLAAIPVIVVVALASYGDLVSGEGGSAGRTALWTLALVVVVATVALPSLGSLALTACLVVVGIQGFAALSAEVRGAPKGS